MQNVVKKIIDKSIGKVGDKMGNSMCPIILYQPKVCKRAKKQVK